LRHQADFLVNVETITVRRRSAGFAAEPILPPRILPPGLGGPLDFSELVLEKLGGLRVTRTDHINQRTIVARVVIPLILNILDNVAPRFRSVPDIALIIQQHALVVLLIVYGLLHLDAIVLDELNDLFSGELALPVLGGSALKIFLNSDPLKFLLLKPGALIFCQRDLTWRRAPGLFTFLLPRRWCRTVLRWRTVRPQMFRPSLLGRILLREKNFHPVHLVESVFRIQ